MKGKGSKTAGIVAFSLQFPYLIIVGTLIILLLGSFALIKLPQDLFPSWKQTAVQVLVFHPEMPAETVEQDLATRIERYTSLAVGLKKTESHSLKGMAIIHDYFRPEVSMNTALTQISSLISSISPQLPVGTPPPLVLPYDPRTSSPLTLVTITGKDKQKDGGALALAAIEQSVQSIEGALAPTLLNNESSGALTANKARNVNNVEPMPANVNQQKNIIRVDGKPKLYVPVYRQPEANALGIVDRLRKSLQELGTQVKDLSLTLLADQSQFIRHTVARVAEETLLGAMLAALSVFLFLGNIRATGGTLLSLPISVCFAFMGLLSLKESLNLMTLGGLALSIGVLVNNSTLVMENILNKIHQGQSNSQAALQGASEMAMPVRVASVAIIVVLFPVIFLQGMTKVLFVALAKSLIFAMVGSYLAAMTLVPLYARHVLVSADSHQQAPWLSRQWLKLMESITQAYSHCLRYFLNHKWMVFVICLMVFIGGLFASSKVGAELLPTADTGLFVIKARIASDSSGNKPMALAALIEKKIHQWVPQQDLKTIVTQLGSPKGLMAAYTPYSQKQDINLLIEFSDDRRQTSQHYAHLIRNKIKTAFPQTQFSFEVGVPIQRVINQGRPSAIDIQVSGPNRQRANEVAQLLLGKVKKVEGAIDARVLQQFNSPIDHKNLQPVIDISVDTQGRDMAHVAGDIQTIVDDFTTPTGYKIQIQGEYGQVKNMFRQFAMACLLSLLLVYLVLVTQLKSFTLSLVAMSSIPLGLAAIFYLLYFTHSYFNIQSAIAAIFIIGSTLSASVLMLNFLIHKTNDPEMDTQQGLIEAASTRLRPVLMISISAIIAVFPMAIGFGKGAELTIPLARAAMVGQFVAMVATLFLVPLLYDLIQPKVSGDFSLHPPQS